MKRPDSDNKDDKKEDASVPPVASIMRRANETSPKRMIAAVIMAIASQIGLATALYATSTLSPHQNAIANNEWSEDAVKQEIRSYITNQIGFRDVLDEKDIQEKAIEHRMRILLGAAQLARGYSSQEIEKTKIKLEGMVAHLEYLLETKGEQAVFDRVAEWAPGYDFNANDIVSSVLEGKGNCQARALQSSFLLSSVFPDKEVKLVHEGADQYGVSHVSVTVKVSDDTWINIDGKTLNHVGKDGFEGKALAGLDSLSRVLAENLGDEDLVERIDKQGRAGGMDLSVDVLPKNEGEDNGETAFVDLEVKEKVEEARRNGVSDLFKTDVGGLSKRTSTTQSVEDMLAGGPANVVEVPKVPKNKGHEMVIRLEKTFGPDALAAISAGEDWILQELSNMVDSEKDKSRGDRVPVSIEIDGDRNDFEWVSKIDFRALNIGKIVIDGKNNAEFIAHLDQLFLPLKKMAFAGLHIKNASNSVIPKILGYYRVYISDSENVTFTTGRADYLYLKNASLSSSSSGAFTQVNFEGNDCEFMNGTDFSVNKSVDVFSVGLHDVTSPDKIKEALRFNPSFTGISLSGKTDLSQFNGVKIDYLSIEDTVNSDSELEGTNVRILNLKNVDASKVDLLDKIKGLRPQKLGVSIDGEDSLDIVNHGHSKTVEELIGHAFASSIRRQYMPYYEETVYTPFYGDEVSFKGEKDRMKEMKQRLEGGEVVRVYTGNVKGADELFDQIDWKKVKASSLFLTCMEDGGDLPTFLDKMKDMDVGDELEELRIASYFDEDVFPPGTLSRFKPRSFGFNGDVFPEDVNLLRTENLSLIGTKKLNQEIKPRTGLHLISLNGVAPDVIKNLPRADKLALNGWNGSSSESGDAVREYLIMHQPKELHIGGIGPIMQKYDWLENLGYDLDVLGFDEGISYFFDPNKVFAKTVVLERPRLMSMSASILNMRPEKLVIVPQGDAHRYNGHFNGCFEIENPNRRTIEALFRDKTVLAEYEKSMGEIPRVFRGVVE